MNMLMLHESGGLDRTCSEKARKPQLAVLSTGGSRSEQLSYHKLTRHSAIKNPFSCLLPPTMISSALGSRQVEPQSPELCAAGRPDGWPHHSSGRGVGAPGGMKSSRACHSELRLRYTSRSSGKEQQKVVQTAPSRRKGHTTDGCN